MAIGGWGDKRWFCAIEPDETAAEQGKWPSSDFRDTDDTEESLIRISGRDGNPHQRPLREALS